MTQPPDGKIKNKILLGLYRKQNGRCYICNGPMSWRIAADNCATIDHVIPKCILWKIDQRFHHGNKKAACRKCNEEKGSTVPANIFGL